MTKEQLDALYKVVKQESVYCALDFVGDSANEYLHKLGYIEIEAKGTYGMRVIASEYGKRYLKNQYEYVIQIECPDTSPFILRSGDEFAFACKNELWDTFDLMKDGNYLGGEVLFTVRTVYMSLYELATLPDWEG